MSLARLVITAVTVEGRSKSKVARDYGGFSGLGAEAGAPLSAGRPGRVPAALSATAQQSAGGRPGDRGPDPAAPQDPHQTGPRCRGGDHRRALGRRRDVAGAGGLHDLADLVPPRVRPAAAAETAPLVVENVLRRAAQRTLAGRHHPLA